MTSKIRLYFISCRKCIPKDAKLYAIFVYIIHYINCLMEELGINRMTGHPTYNLTAMPKVEILQNHNLVILSFGIALSEDDIDLPKLYWIPKLHSDILRAQPSAQSNLFLRF